VPSLFFWRAPATIPLDAYPTGVVDELLDGANLLLLGPKLDEGVREAFLGAMGKSAPQKKDLPVISLSTTTKMESTRGEEGVLSVPWPCSIEDLVGRIETALFIQAASTTQREEIASRCYSRASGNPRALEGRHRMRRRMVAATEDVAVFFRIRYEGP